MYQKIELIGDLGRDPEMRYTPSGQAVTNFSIAVSESYTRKDGEQVKNTTWFRVSSWGNIAENCAKYLSKGSRVFVEGKVKCHVYQKKDGTWEGNLEVTASSVKFLDKMSNGNGAKKDDGEGRYEYDDVDIPGFMQD
jgi:single-strand DNA-binding protein